MVADVYAAEPQGSTQCRPVGSACPFCHLEGGFHDEDVHASIPVPPDKLLPTSSAQRQALTMYCRNCGAGYDELAIPPCRNPRHWQSC